jgi:hypothetical protein
VARGSRGLSDFGVFYRTCQLLSDGVGGELYPRVDAVTTWPVSLSPTGLAIFQPVCALNPILGSALWSAFNLVLLGVTLVVLRRALKDPDARHQDERFAWSAIVFLVLSWGSLQVGQFSVLFVACWILSLKALAAGQHFRSSLLLAIPAAIKIYPAMMVAIPLSLARNLTLGGRLLAQMVAAVLGISLLVPTLAYGWSRAWALNLSFWENVILSPSGQVDYMQTVRHGNQSLDTLLLRFFSYERDFHDLFVHVPHAWFEKAEVVAVVNGFRVLIVFATIAAAWRWRRQSPRTYCWRDLLAMGALWSATLYMLLPETKARYGVYAFLGFLPLLTAAVRGPRDGRKKALLAVEIVALIVLILVLLPGSLQVWGIGIVGALLLWTESLRYVSTGAVGIGLTPRSPSETGAATPRSP